jgi:hypothetical protein
LAEPAGPPQRAIGSDTAATRPHSARSVLHDEAEELGHGDRTGEGDANGKLG